MKHLFNLLFLLFLPLIAHADYLNTQGVNLYYTVSGSGEPIIVLHGGPGLDHTYLLPYMLELNKKHKVIFYDQRGCGKSTPTAINNKMINTQQYVNDLEALRKHLGFKKFILVGHSWGGMLAMRYAIQYPDRISKLILMNSLPASYQGTKAFLVEVDKRMQPIQKQIDTIKNSTAFKQHKLSAIYQYFRLALPKEVYKAADASKINLDFTALGAENMFQIQGLIFSEYNHAYDLRPQLQQLSIPTLVVTCDYDMIPPWTSAEISNAIPNSELVIIKQCGHFTFIEQPKILFEKINAFLQMETSHGQ